MSSKNQPAKHFPVVGFGASAGGLEAFTSVLKHLDPNLGMAYVLIMHLSPTHKSSLAEILQTKTKMKVHTVKDGMQVKPDNVYVIPPNAFMSLVDGHLKLGPRALSAIGNFAIDYFLSALATVYKNNSIGIILSGTATDGTLGLKAIKAEGGITFAQDDTAKFPGMPKNAYNSGYADFILSPQSIARELSQLAKIPYTGVPSHKIEKKHEKGRRNDSEVLKKILLVVKEKTGIDFYLHYKQASVYRRVIRRVVLNKCITLEDYRSLIENNEKEVFDLYNDFLINVTNFFRDPDFYATLESKVFPSIVKQREQIDPIRIWVAGCATGEEAYSIAIQLMEFLDHAEINIPFQIFASDLDRNAIEKARLGVYPLSALQNIPQRLLKRFFKKIDAHYQIGKNVREVCIFSQQNLLKDPPFSRMDLISCQNVLIYLETNPQQKILQTFHYALKPSGYLFLGKSETISGANDLFDQLDKKIRIFRPKATASPQPDFTLKTGSVIPREAHRPEPPGPMDIEKEMGKILLKRFVVPSIVVNQNFNIIQFYGITAPYLEPVVGKASFNVLKMIREDLLLDLKALLHQARKLQKPVLKECIKTFSKKESEEVTIEVIPKKTDNEELFYLVVFKETQIPLPEKILKGKKKSKVPDTKEKTILKLEEELVQSREVIRTTNEEYETTYEELQAYNEEILSSNEELQSVNEELETSKEELQSANEELTTINDELQKRNIELKESQNYAKAIVDTVNSPFLVLTSNLQVRSANRSFYKTFNLAPEETEGNFIFELGDKTWDIPQFRRNLNELLGKRTNYLDFEFRYFLPGADELVFIVNAYRLIKEDSPREILILLAFINISDILKANHELKKLNEHLEQFAFITSHDLQEPLRKIETFSNYLSERGTMDTFTKKYLAKISDTTARMSTLLKDLLSYSQLLKNQEKKFIEIDLNKTIRSVCKDLELLIEEKKALVQIDTLPEILGEPVQINQLFYNLISNSLKFNLINPIINVTAEKISPEDADNVGLKKDRPYVCICVKDNGIGFDQQYADRIFTIFQRLYDKPEVKGSGMGLAICKKIVEDHGGAIFAKSQAKEGATFWIYLPAPVI